MTRMSAGLALFILPAALAAPAVKGKPGLYHPTKVGDKRVYESKEGGTTKEILNEVSEVEEVRKGVLRVTVLQSTARGSGRQQLAYEVSDQGVFNAPPIPESAVAVQQILRLPPREGDSWTQDTFGDPPPQGIGPKGGPAIKQPKTFTMGKEEEVEVPAGKFKAVRVVSKWSLNGRDVENTSWHAPGVGVVKMVTKAGGTEEVRVLKSFTPGK
jgi:hypothetical protein